jgi:hypothetical protein
MVDVADFFRIIEEEKADKQTFLYLRNGDQVFCLATGIEFGAQLFPDIDRDDLDGKLWAKISSDSVKELISENRYKVEVKKAKEARAEHAQTFSMAPCHLGPLRIIRGQDEVDRRWHG